ncbi:hypothetical protein REPUB_Repub13aG0005100 [Reevesia pubescens]
MMLLLEFNGLSGFVPDTLGNLRILKWFTIRANYFIPKPGSRELSFFSSFVKLRYLELVDRSDNPLNSILPTSIGNLSKFLQSFYAHSCKLKSSIPTEVGNITSLMIFHLSNNELSGSVAPTIGSLRNIQGLFLIKNKIQGSIPQTLCGLERLYELRISFNKLRGPLPTCLGNLTSLGYLFLESNKLSSTIPSTLWSLKDIIELDLSSNYLSSFSPPDIVDMKALSYLNLSKKRKQYYSERVPVVPTQELQQKAAFNRRRCPQPKHKNNFLQQQQNTKKTEHKGNRAKQRQALAN